MATKDLDFGNVIKQVYDPATESLQVTVVTGGGGGATAAKQDQQTAILTTLDTSTNAVEASSAAIQVSTTSIDTKASAIQTAVQATAVSTASVDAKLTSLSVVGSFSIDFTSIPDSVSAPFEVIASLPSTVKQIAVYDTTGSTIQIRIGVATGTLLLFTGPGQDNTIQASIASSTRVSIRSNGTAPTAGSYIITFLG